MALNIHNLIAAINPDLYCKDFEDDFGLRVDLRQKVKDFLKANPGNYAGAAGIAKPIEQEFMDFDKLRLKNPIDNAKSVLKSPVEKHALYYDSTGENLEPVYFWILDKLWASYRDMKQVDKLIDNFVSSPGSGHFSEVGQKATRMQEEAMKMLGAANQVIKSILNIVYDLKEFKTRHDLYDKYKSGNDEEKRSAMLSLKQIWMDTVDMKRGTTSLKGLVQQFQYVTIIDAFMASEDLKQAGNLDLNDRVKRILEQRIGEFLEWVSMSEVELRKRYEIEKRYLKSQVNTVHLYARWAKPYLRAVRKLEQNANADDAALVTSFNTVLFELLLLGQSKYDPADDVNRGELPEILKKTKLKKIMPIIVVELKFRSIPERAGQQGYGFRGKVDLVFTSYALDENELKILKNEIQKDDIGDLMEYMEGATTGSLDYLKQDIDNFLGGLDDGPKKDEKKKDEAKESEDTNPFSALFSIFKPGKKDEKKKEGISKDNDMEKVVRAQAIAKAREECRKFYDLYKKEHGMPAF